MATKPTRRRRPPREEVRRRLLDAATDVFAERGIDRASLDDVAARAGLTKGAIYSNFAGKDELVYALMDEHIARREGLAVGALAGEAAGAAQRAGDALTDALSSEARWQRLFIEFWARAQRDDDVRAEFAARRAEAREDLGALIAEEAKRRELVLPLAPEELATTLLALSNGLAIERLTDEDAVADDLLGRLLALLLGPG